jgi:hypothetical protein
MGIETIDEPKIRYRVPIIAENTASDIPFFGNDKKFKDKAL